jgi:hypothetical protein
MQPSKIVPQSSIFTFDSAPIGLTDNLIASRNKPWIDRPSVDDIKEALPDGDDRILGFPFDDVVYVTRSSSGAIEHMY